METGNSWLKAVVTLIIGTGAALWGWFGWLLIVWAACMILDYVSGSIAAARAGQWSSEIARAGLFHKLGMLLAVIVAIVLDLLIGLIVHAAPINLPFNYTVFFSPLVLCWYSFTELGSITENAVKLGAPVPTWLKKAIAVGKQSIDNTATQKGGETNVHGNGNQED